MRKTGKPLRLMLAADERGASALEYLGAVIAAATIVAVLLLAAPGLGEAIGGGIRLAICRVAGSACPDSPSVVAEPDACVRSSEARSFGASLKVTFVQVGKREGYTVEERSDGEIHVTWFDEGRVGATAGIGAEGGIVLPSGDARAGASLSGVLEVGANLGETWVFGDEGEAREFVNRRRNHAYRENAEALAPPFRLVTAANDLIRGGPGIREPDLVFFEPVAGGQANSNAVFGPAQAEAGADGSMVVGGVYDRRTGETTLYVELDGTVAGSAGLLVGASGSEGRGAVVALTLDRDRQPKGLAVTRTTASGRGGLIGGTGLTLDDVGDVFGEVTGGFDAEATRVVNITSELDLEDPRNRRVAVDLFVASTAPVLPGGAERYRRAAEAYATRVRETGKVSVTEYDGETWGLGAGAQVALGPKLGFDVGYEAEDSRLTAAHFLAPPVPGSERRLVPWTACAG